jgi:hypothetical protein
MRAREQLEREGRLASDAMAAGEGKGIYKVVGAGERDRSGVAVAGCELV